MRSWNRNRARWFLALSGFSCGGLIGWPTGKPSAPNHDDADIDVVVLVVGHGVSGKSALRGVVIYQDCRHIRVVRGQNTGYRAELCTALHPERRNSIQISPGAFHPCPAGGCRVCGVDRGRFDEPGASGRDRDRCGSREYRFTPASGKAFRRCRGERCVQRRERAPTPRPEVWNSESQMSLPGFKNVWIGSSRRSDFGIGRQGGLLSRFHLEP